MKIIVTGSLGHISLPLTKTLVQHGHAVTVISSKPEKQAEITALGATAAIGTLEDTNFLTATFTGADAVYCMVPPQNYFDPGLDLIGCYKRIGNNYAEAIQKAGVKRVVNLSTFGAHLAKGNGILEGAYHLARVLDALPADVAITHMRPTSFYYNMYNYMPAIKSQGVIMANYGGNDLVPWVAPADIAVAIAEELEAPLTGRKIRYVASEELTCSQVAHIIGQAIGKPDLQWITVTDEQALNSLLAIGMNPTVAAGMVEMYGAMHNGSLSGDYDKHRPELGKTKMAEFAKEFAAVYQQK